MAEEQQCQEIHLLCANNCGFFGSPATLNLCSKCYRDLRLKEEQASAKIAVGKSFLPPSTSSPPPIPSVSTIETLSVAIVEAPPVQPQTGRCTTCQKRVGLTGFQCRCGMTFCGMHRLPETHSCSFDYKAVGREAITRSNPFVKASKLDRI